MKPLEFSVLLALAEEDRYGYAIVKRIAQPEAGGIRLAPSNLYYVLDRMLASGLVEEATSTGEPEDLARRRYYRITSRGRAAFAREAKRLAELVRTAERLHMARQGEA
jgi:DNA-binding PadR family transcriptional regulator